MGTLSRRNLLKGSGAAAAGVVGFSQLFGYRNVFAQNDGDDPQTILNLAATAETFACVHYYTAINSADALGLTDREISQLTAFLDSELKHKQFLEANGAQALATEFFVPENLFSDRQVFVETTNTAENWFVAAYLAATRRFAELGESLLAATATQVSAVEAEHQALIRLMGGLQPSFQTLKEPLFWNTSEVAPLFQPFLEGADGFTGPAGFPGVDTIQSLVGNNGVENVTPFIQLNGQGTLAAAAAPAATPQTSTTGACTALAANTNVRAQPTINSAMTDSLTSGEAKPIIGQTTGADGFVWYQVDTGWVRSDVVRTSGDCSAIPTVSQ
jgi:hypothetical protein